MHSNSYTQNKTCFQSFMHHKYSTVQYTSIFCTLRQG